MSRYWSHVVHGLTPYVPGEQPRLDNLVKLNTNEHPYGPSPRALAAIQSAAVATLRLYPDPNAEALKTALAEYHGLRPDQVFVGNGSDEVLAHAFMALLNQERPLWFPDITYSFYPVYCGLYGIQSETIPLAEDFSIRAQDYLPTPHRRAGGIIFPNPNAPTGRFMTLADVEQVVAANAEVVVVIDEAYVDFGGDSAVGLVERYPNLLVVQTFSKSRALAGLRVGFALGHPALIEALERVKNSFNSYPLDRLALAGAVASVQDEAYFQESRRKVMATRANLVAGMAGLGFEVLPSTANFIFTRHPNREAAELALALRQRAIIVRHFRLPRIDQFLRITVGTDDQCAILISALAELLRD
jgi:histidinol-phosphate aminotransferase